MKKLILLTAIFSSISSLAFAKYVSGHYRSNGTYVQGYQRSDANNTKFDNYSTRGNTNPYTGEKGYVDPYSDY